MYDDYLYHMAERKVNEKIKFYNKVFRYIFVNIILFIVNFIYTPSIWWCSAVMLFWSIGLIFRFFRVFVFDKLIDDNYREYVIEKEMNKMQ